MKKTQLSYSPTASKEKKQKARQVKIKNTGKWELLTLRKYQKKIDKATTKWFESDAQRGYVYAPTGSGKTELFSHLIYNVLCDQIIATAARAGKFRRILIAHPRLALSSDQQKRLNKRFGGRVEFTSFHSGSVHQSERRGTRYNISTTNVVDLENLRNRANGPHITFTTYDSLPAIAHLDFDLIIADEAHNLCLKKHKRSLHKFNTKTIFYTATPVCVDGQDESMDNAAFFGEEICTVKPVELIRHGYVVAPRVIALDVITKAGNSQIKADTIETLALAFNDQKARLAKDTTIVKHKMLAAMAGTAEFPVIMEGLSKLWALVGPDVDVYTVASDSQRMSKNGVVWAKDREALLEDFAASANRGCESIILHCDTIAEGLDVDGLTGLLLFRSLSKSKLIQTIGRICRPYYTDLVNGEPIPLEQREKKFAYVTMLTVDGAPYVAKGLEIVDAFTIAGYDEITSYIDQPPEEGGKGDKRDPYTVIYSALEDSAVHEEEIQIVAEALAYLATFDPMSFFDTEEKE